MTFFRERGRWLIAGLLFFISTVAFLDRQALSVLEKTLEEILGFSPAEYSYIVTGFLIATGIGYSFAGRVIDRFGVRKSFTVALAVWSVAAVAHSLAVGWISLLLLRVVLGLGESFYTPAAARVLRDLDSAEGTWSLLGGVFHREFCRGDDCTSAGGLAGPALSLAIQLRRHGGVGIRAPRRLGLVLSFSGAAPLVVRRGANGDFK